MELKSRRNIRHAAALALVGWYLMVPPLTRFWWIGPERYDNAAPLSRWTNAQAFDRAQPCQVAQQSTGLGHGVCVATDDPRLKRF
jgi:hypothetical protein